VLWLKWSEYKRLIDHDLQSGLRRVPERILFKEGHPDKPPQVLALYRQCEKWGKWWEGGVADQPHLLMAEFEMCQAAIAYFERVELPYLMRTHQERLGST
jgi:hypothetical protein